MRYPTFRLHPLLLSAAFLIPATSLHAAPAEHLTVWEMVQSVGWILVPLALLSVLVLALIIFNFIWLRDDSVASLEFLDDARHHLKNRKLEDLIECCRRHKGSCAHVLGRVVEFARDHPETSLEGLKEIAQAEGGRAVSRISRPNLLLMDLGAMCPMVGLLGTVIGILRSFGNIAGETTPMRTVLLAGGVSQALMATAIGLVIGLTAMLFYAYFRGRVQALVAHFEINLTDLLIQTSNCLARGRS